MDVSWQQWKESALQINALADKYLYSRLYLVICDTRCFNKI